MGYNNFNEILVDLGSLIQDIENIRQKIVTASGVSYTSKDARHVSLEGLQCDIAACSHWMTTLISLKGIAQEKYGEQWDNEYRKLIGTGLNSAQAEDLMLDYIRNTLTTKVHFKIENLFSNILKVLSASPTRNGFWNISNAILTQSGISTTGSEKRTLTVLANLRNSYHANGIHNTDSLTVVINGTTFEFIEGDAVKCASWEHIVVALRANISVLDSILFSSTVSNIQSEIPDAFAASMP